MSRCYVVPKKPFCYRLKARIFEHLRKCAVIAEKERYMKVIEAGKLRGLQPLWTSLDEL